jgi:hypothetical protein
MFDQDVAVVRKAAPPGHAFGGLGKRQRTQDDGGDPQLLEFGGVVQTAPRTRPSIAYGVDDYIRLLGQLLELAGRREHA